MTPWLWVASAQLVNVTLGFVIALAVTLLILRIAPTDNLAKWCACLPIAKALALVVAGVPAGAYVLSPHAGQRWELGNFQLGIGFERPLLVPRFVGRLGALQSDEWFGLSVGDGVTHFFVTRGWGVVPLVVVLGVALISLVRVTARLSAGHQLRKRERADRARALELTQRRVLFWKIPVLIRIDDQPTAVSGICRPVIWLSRALAAAAPEIRCAAIEHELSHVRHADVLLFSITGLFRDVFWFLPGARWLERRVRRSAELAADAAALRRGATAAALAHAILHEGEARAMAVGLGGSTALDRVRRLSSPAPTSHIRLKLRMLLATYVGVGLMLSQFCGYH